MLTPNNFNSAIKLSLKLQNIVQEIGLENLHPIHLRIFKLYLKYVYIYSHLHHYPHLNSNQKKLAVIVMQEMDFIGGKLTPTNGQSFKEFMNDLMADLEEVK